MSYRAYNRQYELMINDQEQQRIWRLLDVRGSIKMTSDTKPNEAEIIIVNQSDDSFKFVARKGLNMIFRAGYGDNVAQVFKGAIEWVDPAKEENDWVTTIRAKDGAINYRNISIQKTFKKDTPIATVFQGVIEDLLVNPAMQDRIDQINKLAKGTIDIQKIQLNYARAQQTHNRGKKTKILSFEEFKAKQLAQADSRAANANQIKLLKARALEGAAHEVLDLLCSSYGLKWYINNQTLHVVPAGGAINGDIIKVSPESGLIGSPEEKEDGSVAFRSNLRHEFMPAVAVFLESRRTTGAYLLREITHIPDKRGEWVSECEAMPYVA